MISTESTAGKIVLTDVPSDLRVLKYKHNETMRHMLAGGHRARQKAK
mgnify:CR=1 FL=1